MNTEERKNESLGKNKKRRKRGLKIKIEGKDRKRSTWKRSY